MQSQNLSVSDGPDRPALRLALAYPGAKDVRLSIPGDTFTMRVLRLDEQRDGVSYRIEGVVSSGVFKDQAIAGIYSVDSRTGTLHVGDEEARS